MWTIQSTLGRINPMAEPIRPIDESKVIGIIESLPKDADGKPVWNQKPVLSVADKGDGFLAIDGLHRMAAARRLELESIDAYVIPRDEFEELIDMEFCGQVPPDLNDLDDCILVGGDVYKE